MIVDTATSHVFVSCPSTNSVAVLDFSGNLVTTVDNIAGANGLADVGGAVYVSTENTGTVDAINPTTLVARSIGATGLVDAADLVSSAGYLWSTSSPTAGEQASAPLYRIDPSNGAVTTYSSLLGPFIDVLLPDPGSTNEFLASTSRVF
jgi:hypothetical protein